MRSTTALLVLVVITQTLSCADATVTTICKAASDKDVRVNYSFCVSELTNNRYAPDGDAWGLAKAAAELGANNAYLAINTIVGLKMKSGSDAKKMAALKLCDEVYNSMSIAFLRANHMINERNYIAGKEEATKAISQAHQCDVFFAWAGVPSPLVQCSLFSVQIAIICTAITNLIK